MMNDEVVVDVSCIAHMYAGGTRVEICGQRFSVTHGQRVAIMGPNGCGKSTLLKHILGLLKPTDGRVSVFGRDPARDYARIRNRIGAVMQDVEAQLVGPSVFDDVAFAPLNFGMSRHETFRRVESILHALRIYHLRDRLPHYLSGGEMKKVALAGALVFGPDLLILDEPMEGIDYASRCEIADFLRELHAQSGMTMISTLHDMDWVADLADYGYVMRSDGRLDLYGSVTELFYDHDLREYNLAPPAVVRLVKSLRDSGFELSRSLSQTVFEEELLRLLRGR